MADTILKTVIQLRNDTTENWLIYKDSIPAKGEPCLDIDTGFVKYGDGVTSYGDLPIAGSGLVSGDNLSVEVINDIVKLKGIDTATEGQQLRINSDGEIEWFSVDTTILDSLSDSIDEITSNIEGLQDGKADVATTLAGYGITDAMTATEIQSAITSAITNSGSAKFEIVDEIPEADGANDNILYLVMNQDTGYYDIYIKALNDVVRLDDTTIDLSDYSTTSEITALLDGKVDKLYGSRLITSDEVTKLDQIEEGAQVNIIDNVSDEFDISDDKVLSIISISQSKITGLTDVLDNKIETILLGDTELAVETQTVSIPIATTSLGVVRSSNADNGVTIAEDGTMSVNQISMSNIIQEEGATLYLNGGNSSNI